MNVFCVAHHVFMDSSCKKWFRDKKNMRKSYHMMFYLVCRLHLLPLR